MVSRQLIGKFNKRDRHNTNVLQGLSTQHTDSADPAIWNEGKKPRCQDGQEDTQAACSQYAHACGFLEEADELGHALELERRNEPMLGKGLMNVQNLSSGHFVTFREPCVERDIHATWMRHSGGVVAMPN